MDRCPVVFGSSLGSTLWIHASSRPWRAILSPAGYLHLNCIAHAAWCFAPGGRERKQGHFCYPNIIYFKINHKWSKWQIIDCFDFLCWRSIIQRQESCYSLSVLSNHATGWIQMGDLHFFFSIPLSIILILMNELAVTLYGKSTLKSISPSCLGILVILILIELKKYLKKTAKCIY